MDQLLTKEESYAERRKLFKNIWHTALDIGEKDDNIFNKPKVIKTLRLDEVDRCAIGNKKKQKIRNLRAVCNRILDFCDCQDEDDMFYEQLISPNRPLGLHYHPKKLKPHQVRKRIKKTKSFNEQPDEIADPRATTSDRKERYKNHLFKHFKVTRKSSPTKRVYLKKSPLVISKAVRQVRHKSKKNDKQSTYFGSKGVAQPKTSVKTKRNLRRKSLTAIQKGAERYHRNELVIRV